MLNEQQRDWIQQKLLDWYHQNKRDLPWRKDKDPYKIWVSEVMLQQTRVETVIPYYNRFIKKFPSLRHLAKADEDEVMKAWEGLGYYSRARNLHAAVKEVVAKYDGRVPSKHEEISSLKGVGPYTAGAILSIAFDQKFAAVDGNVLRVIARLFSLPDDIARASTRKKVEKIILDMIPDDAPGDFNQALMELGATVCIPTSPTCLLCPLREICQGFASGLQDELPRKKKTNPPKKIPVVFLWIEDGKLVLLEKREQSGLLAQMWSFPTLEHIARKEVASEVEKYLLSHNLAYSSYEIIGHFDHVFSHRHWLVTMVKVLAKKKDLPQDKKQYAWFRVDELQQIALANVYQKAYQLGIASG